MQSNWRKLRKVAETVPKPNSGKTTTNKLSSNSPKGIVAMRQSNATADTEERLSKREKAKYVGLDCEMVGLGEDGKESALARCCIVDYDGNVLYDRFVRPKGFVTDFRTKYSGIRKQDLRADTAIQFADCQRDVAALLKGKVLVGHALHNDLNVLLLSHPRRMIRDTARYVPYMRNHGRFGKKRPRALKDLTRQHLKLIIQTGEHDPSEDARCAMMLYRRARTEWENSMLAQHDQKADASTRTAADGCTVPDELEDDAANDDSDADSNDCAPSIDDAVITTVQRPQLSSNDADLRALLANMQSEIYADDAAPVDGCEQTDAQPQSSTTSFSAVSVAAVAKKSTPSAGVNSSSIFAQEQHIAKKRKRALRSVADVDAVLTGGKRVKSIAGLQQKSLKQKQKQAI